MNKSEDPNAPKNQEIAHAPHGGRNERGEVVADATESAGQGSAWESSGDLSPEEQKNAEKSELTNDEGYSSGPDNDAWH